MIRSALALILVLAAGGAAAQQDRRPSHCIAIAAAVALKDSLMPVEAALIEAIDYEG